MRREREGRWKEGGTGSQLQLRNKPSSPENETQTPPQTTVADVMRGSTTASKQHVLTKRFAREFVAEDLRYLLQRCEIRGQLNPAT